MARLNFPGLDQNLRPLRAKYVISGIECPFSNEEECTFKRAYNEEIAYILTGQVDPNEFKLDNIIEEVKSWK